MRLWLSALIGAIIYPALIQLFGNAIDGYHATGSTLFATAASLSILLAASVPVLAARALILTRRDCAINSVLRRSVLYLMFAVAPLYVFMLQLTGALGAAEYQNSIWIAGWIAAGAACYFQRAPSAPTSETTGVTGLRMIHGATALLLLVGFLIGHLLNHDLAIWSVDLHHAAMEWLRVWYRSAWLEPVLLTLLLVLIATGVPMVVQHSRHDTDSFRIVQMATGVYIGLFLCAHLVAVLGARSVGVETDWYFATGSHGLLDGRGMLIPYYIYAAFFMALHVGCGLRIVLLKHSVAELMANKAVYTAAAAGLVVTTLLAIAAFGFHIASS